MRAARRPPHRPPSPPAPAPRALRLRLGLLLLAALSVSPAFPADRDADQREADARQTLYIRRAFKDDPGLQVCDEVSVSVRGTVARLWGKVRSPALKQRALFLAKQVKGIAEVRGDELVVSEEGMADLPSPFPEGVPPQGTLAGNHRDGHTTEVPKRPDYADPEPARAPPGESVTLLAPVPVSRPTDPPVEMLPPRPLASPPSLEATIEALRQKDERFRGVRVEVRQKTVYLRGTVKRWDDAGAFANAVRRLPGVEAVILDSLRVEAR
jgi:osmotically-inducible protein OsmY